MEGARQSIVIDGVSWEEDDHVYAILLLDLLLQFFLQFYILGLKQSQMAHYLAI